MCSAAECGRVEEGDGEVFQLSDPEPTKGWPVQILPGLQGPGQVPPPPDGLGGPPQLRATPLSSELKPFGLMALLVAIPFLLFASPTPL